KHVIVCGHYGCGGVNAAMSDTNFGLLNNWLRNIKDVYASHVDEVHALPDPKAQFDRMVELNVLAQVHNLVKTSTIQKSWGRRKAPVLHGWVYGLADGRLKALTRVEPNNEIEDVYRYTLTEADLSDAH
ncbi:MAG: carbonic anhydrase, partial [Alphaproteobacteria bacterium]|nr:carbonic anhydrase [Alphaproteobacteria bacterium]